MSSILPLLCCLTGLLKLGSALSPISVKGTKLYNQNGTQFFVKGVTYQMYQPEYVADPLLDNDQCQIDAGLMNTLGINTIRVHSVDGTQNHDACMNTFASQGIYVWIDLPTTDAVISSDNPDWTIEMYNTWTATFDAFAQYDNLLALGIGNEIISDNSSVASAPFIKAAARDIKAFRDARQYRQIPVAYTTGDEVAYRATIASYLACGDQSDGIDLYGLATYSWCGNSSVYDSGYDQIYEEFEGLNMPVLFSEVGCNWIEPRVFTEVETILGTVFPATFSGAMVYEWSETNDDFGIVSYTQADYKGFPTTMGGYDTLKTVLANANPVSTAATAYTPSISPPACPTSNTNWPLDGSIPLPTIAGLDLSTVTPITTTLTGADSTAAATSWLAGITSAATAPIDDGSSSNTEPLPRIAVTGISVAIAAILSAIIFFFRFRRTMARRKTKEKIANEDSQQSEEDIGQTDKPELPAISSSRIVPKSELDACVDSVPDSPSSPVIVHDKSPDHPLELGSHHCARYPLEMKGSLPIICEIDGKEKQYP